MNTSLAKLPYVKTLESFDFSFQPSIDVKGIRELATCLFIERSENVVFLGPPESDKTPLRPQSLQDQPRMPSAPEGGIDPLARRRVARARQERIDRFVQQYGGVCSRGGQARLRKRSP